MLPTKGHFQDIECPYYDAKCSRPYCHFRHRKKPQDAVEEPQEAAQKETAVPTYKPTPKSELANIKSHIPITYIPDVAFRPAGSKRPPPKFNAIKPTYNPTPLSILSSANNNKPEEATHDDIEGGNDHFRAIRELKLNMASLEYNPETSLKDEIDFEGLSEEFDMIDDIIEDVPDKTTKEDSSKATKVDNEPTEDNKVKKPRNEKDAKRSSSSRSKSSHKSKSHSKSSSSNSKKNDQKKESDHKSRHSSSSSKSNHSSSKSKEKEKSRHKDDKDRRSSSSSKHKTKYKDKEKSKSKEKEEKKRRTSLSNSSNDIHNDPLDSIDIDFDTMDVDIDLEDEDTMLECYKIFNEYKPPDEPEINQNKAVIEEPHEEIKTDPVVGKKRIAHSSGNVSDFTPKIHHVKPKQLPTPAQVLANRLKLAKAAQGDNEQTNIAKEVKLQQQTMTTSVKRPAPSLIDAARSYKVQKLSKQEPTGNLVDTIINGAKVPPKVRKIAPVTYVNSIQKAKARIEEMNKQKAINAINKTPSQTVRGNKRVAHVPEISLSDIPDVLNADKSKLPINVRTRFLTMIAEECGKLYLNKEDAYTRALNEEFTCYEKCKVLQTYKNSAMLAVNRLRKEFQEREQSGLGLIGSGESTSKRGGDSFNGQKFYDNIQKYVLSEEELDLHGYPRESSTPGRAVIRNPRNKTSGLPNLPEDQRKCARCHKIYLIDRIGFALYGEECIYHPLKKRTLRGVQTYLCCKTSDSSGCVTANTHVCEMPEEAELEGFQTTMAPERDDDPRSHAVYALDCEMCYTVKGLELTRVTIVDSECKTIYESLVKPLNPIVDYNTTFSGITKDQMDRTSTGILQVQANILHLCNSKTILIGHSLESDMKALKIVHGTVIDTSVMFPHKMGLPHKRALRALASDYLKKIIQNNISGHDSAEDAVTCMELVKWKLKEELKVKGLK